MNSEIVKSIKGKAAALGLSFCNIASSDITFDKDILANWYASGYAADMGWLKDNIDKRIHPASIFEGAKSIIVCGLNYYQRAPRRNGKIATYALGRDYHKVLGKKLKELAGFVDQFGGTSRYFVDTAPILERPIAQIAGAGWIGKSSLLVHPRLGTYFFLGEIFTTLELETDVPHKNYCGTCTRCIDACPTGAIVANGVVDARKCISYHTIENKGEIPDEIISRMGDRMYGCDECTAVCPWNRFVKQTTEKDFDPRNYPDPEEILNLNEEDFTKLFAGSPIHRIGLKRFQRNILAIRKSAKD